MIENTYGQAPVIIDHIDVECDEMMYYQYLPIKFSGYTNTYIEDRLDFVWDIYSTAKQDFITTFGRDKFIDMYVYLTVKNLYQIPGRPFNRLGWHSDGFMTDDINYIWSSNQPTIFNASEFNLTQDYNMSMIEMEKQARECNNFQFDSKLLIRLDQYNIHKVADISDAGMRLFVKISFSKDRYDLIGNSKNYKVDYEWDMKPRSIERNIPQSKITK